MKKIMIALFLLPVLAQGHPGIGIVKDKKGNIFYSDLEQVWKISTDGKRTIAVPNVHTHELYMDSAGNLYGEHLWYNGEQLNTWGHYVWSLKNDGSLTKVIEPKEGFLENYSFVRDDAGNTYWVERWKVSRIKKKTPDGKVVTFAEGRWGDVRWMFATTTGIIYFTNWHNLYKVDSSGNVLLLANDIDRTKKEYKEEMHNLYGIWTDAQENIYVAIRSGEIIKKITPVGEVSVVYQSNKPWTPTGGVFDNDGNLWVLEFNLGDVQVKKIDLKKAVTNAKNPSVGRTWFLAGVVVFLLMCLGVLFLYVRTSKGKKIRAVETALKPLINNL